MTNLQIAFCKIGFHVGVGGNRTGFGEYLATLADAGVPVTVTSADDFGVVAEVLNASTDNTVIIRWTKPHGRNDDHPILANDAHDEAVAFWKLWQEHKLPELAPWRDRELYISPTNEIARQNNAYAARFCQRFAELAIDAGWKVALPNFNAGEPEAVDWHNDDGDAPLEPLLRFASAHRDRVLLTFHEGKFIGEAENGEILDMTSPVAKSHMFYTGRFVDAFVAADALGIARPRGAITEWAWSYDQMPDVETAMRDVVDLALFYAHYHEIVGVCLWTTHGGAAWAGLPNALSRMIPLIAEYARDARFHVDPPPTPPDDEPPVRGEPRIDYSREYWVLPPTATADQCAAVIRMAHDDKRQTVGWSYDDGGIGNLTNRRVVCFGIDDADQPLFTAWFNEHYPGVDVSFRALPGEPTPPVDDGFRYTHWPTPHRRINQAFGANPDRYAQYGLPGHEGVDIYANHGDTIRAVAGGVVYAVDAVGTGHNYGIHVRVSSGKHRMIYAHLLDVAVTVGNRVDGGDVIGRADNTGNSFGDHLHLTHKHDDAFVGGARYIGYPYEIIDPTPYLDAIPDATPPTTTYRYDGPDVDFVPMLHGPADDWAWNTGDVVDAIATANLPVKYLSHGVNASHFVRGRAHMVRVFWKPDRQKTAIEAWEDVGGDVMRFYNAGARDFELFNEPNLTSEGLGLVWFSGEHFGNWLRAFAQIMRTFAPDARLWFPGMSPGVPWTNQFAFTNDAWPIVRDLMHGFCMHAYTGETANVETAVDGVVAQIVELQRYLKLQVPLFVSELSVNRPASSQHRATVYRTIEKRLRAVPGVAGVAYFVAQWLPELDVNGESWAGTALPQIYASMQ
jgi:hypothetical protein